MTPAHDIRTLREAGWSDAKIAARVGVSVRSIASWRMGKTPRPICAATLARIAAAVERRKP